MANVRDSDTSLWLHNKLGTSNDSWTGGSICSQLNAEVLRNIKDCFPDLQTQVKLKLLLSFFHIPRRNIDEWRVELDEILEVAQVDSEQWVSMLAESMKTLPTSGSLNTSIVEVDENRRIFSDLVNDLRKLVKKHSDLGMLPLECHYLNKTALVSVFGQQSLYVKHFTLKKKPKSSSLRTELLLKSVDAVRNLKKSAAPTVPVRSRGMPRKMTDTTPLKGIPSRVPSGGFRTPTITSPISRPRPPAIRKDGGIKLLDIADQPLGYAQAKKRKRLQEIEEAKRASEAAASTSPVSGGSTPDYAMGLNPATPLSQPVYTPVPAVPKKSPAVMLNGGTPNSTLISPTPPATPAPTLPVLSCQIQAPITNHIIHIRQTSTQQQSNNSKTTNSISNTGRPNLSLTRSHMLAAQEMFRTSNKVTRPEKALILGFMAGSRENPCPQLGNIVTIKLSENIETVRNEDDSEYYRLVETHFQMNYNTGEWKKINKYRELDDSQVAAIQQQQKSQMIPPSPVA